MFSVCLHPDLEGRMRFKAAAQSIPALSKVHVTGSMIETRERLSGSMTYEAIYVSDHYQREVVSGFVRAIKETKGGQDSAIMLLVREGSEILDDVRESDLSIDGYLEDPFTSESLGEAHKIASRVHQERTCKRQHAAIDVIIRSFGEQIDSAAQLLRIGGEVQQEMRKLKALSRTVQSLPKDLQSIYYTRLIERFELSESRCAGEISKNVDPLPKAESRRIVVKRG